MINFDDPRYSHRCNPLNPSFLSDIADAYESAYVIMLNLNKSWIQKQGDFFVESPIVLFAAVIWYLKIYENGKELTSCRLTQSYYWVIGDNRAGMSDSRSFGVLPHSHLIGKGVCIGYSRNPEKPFWQSLRTDRFFKTEL